MWTLGLTPTSNKVRPAGNSLACRAGRPHATPLISPPQRPNPTHTPHQAEIASSRLIIQQAGCQRALTLTNLRKSPTDPPPPPAATSIHEAINTHHTPKSINKLNGSFGKLRHPQRHTTTPHALDSTRCKPSHSMSSHVKNHHRRTYRRRDIPHTHNHFTFYSFANLWHTPFCDPTLHGLQDLFIDTPRRAALEVPIPREASAFLFECRSEGFGRHLWSHP